MEWIEWLVPKPQKTWTRSIIETTSDVTLAISLMTAGGFLYHVYKERETEIHEALFSRKSESRPPPTPNVENLDEFIMNDPVAQKLFQSLQEVSQPPPGVSQREPTRGLSRTEQQEVSDLLRTF